MNRKNSRKWQGTVGNSRGMEGGGMEEGNDGGRGDGRRGMEGGGWKEGDGRRGMEEVNGRE